eukprot:883788-Rhodomonas_salina.1
MLEYLETLDLTEGRKASHKIFSAATMKNYSKPDKETEGKKKTGAKAAAAKKRAQLEEAGSPAPVAKEKKKEGKGKGTATGAKRGPKRAGRPRK